MSKLFALPFVALASAFALPAEPSFDVHSVPLGARPLRMVVAQLDAGPTPDVAILLRSGAFDIELLTLEGAGNGRLIRAELQQLQQIGYANTPSLASGHLDQDAWLDLGITTLYPKGVFLGDGALGFTAAGWLPSFGGSQHGLGFTDVDGDGDLDSAMLVNDLGGWFIDIGHNTGSGTLTGNLFVNAPGTPTGEARLLFADVDGDGRDATFVVGGSGLAHSKYPGGPSTNELLVAGSLGEVIAAHLDGDNRLDLAVVSQGDGGVFVLMNDGNGGFPSATLYKTGRLPESLTAGDLDGDGDLDLAIAHFNGGDVGILLGDGTGSFTPGGQVKVGAGPIDIEAVDLDLDGDVDLLVALNGAESLIVMLNRLTP